MSEKYNSIEIETERQQFKQLLAVNPNFFGNLPASKQASILKIVGNTRYEEISCVAYNPDLDLLEAVVKIKMPRGYNGCISNGGSSEFVRFFVNYGKGWQDVGIASFKAHDLANEIDGEGYPLSYAISLEHRPNRDRCNPSVVPKVRAILSWEVMPPTDPNWQSVWGNVVERHIQIAPRPRKLIEFANDLIKTIDSEAVLSDELGYLGNTRRDLSTPLHRSIETLAKLYQHQHSGCTVEPHRFAMADVQATLASSLLYDPMVDEAKLEQYQANGLDWQTNVTELAKPQGDVRYEQLCGLGLDYNREWVVANFTIKRPAGYQGSHCEHGSMEHVAFWVDWDNNGEWTYLATVGVRVHDIATIPADGLNYWVGVPARLGEHRRSGKEARIGRLRAVLSWNVRPSDTDPHEVPHWGNRLDTFFEIKPGRILGDQPAIDTIGGIGVAYINVGGDGMTVPNAPFSQTGSPADPWVASRRCAFGGDIYVNAEAPLCFHMAGYKYRLLVRKAGSSGSGEPLMSPFVVTRNLALGGGTLWVSPELGTGWVNYLHPDQNIYSVLGNWQSGNLIASERNELWEIKLELADSISAILASTDWLRIQLDNQAPIAAIHIGRSFATLDCNDFDRDSTVSGHFVAYDPNGHFGAWALETTTNSLLPIKPVTNPALPNSSPTESTLGHGWKLDTSCISAASQLLPCEYLVTVSVWDNTIVNSSQFVHHYTEAEVVVCVRSSSLSMANPSGDYGWQALAMAGGA
ncbi:MAG: hypothetical protein LUQ11_00035 [Methylococcaceae bacterium]|nr:hypothetical protein [Methylococcaceae bacterium]